MGRSPFFRRRDKEIYNEYNELLEELFYPGKKIKKQIKSRLARKYCLSRSRIEDILISERNKSKA